MQIPIYQPPDQAALEARARAQAQAEAQAILNQINSQYEIQRTRAIQEQQRQAAATDEAYRAAAPKIENTYSNAINDATGIENSVSARLASLGSAATSDYRSKLAQINAPDQIPADELQKLWSGVGGAKYARGMSDVGRLVTRKAEAQAYNEKAPGLARQASQADLNKLLQEMFDTYSQQQGEVTAGVPGKSRDIFNEIYGREEGRTKDIYQSKQDRYKQFQEDLQAAQEAKIVAQQLGDKKAQRAAAAREKVLQREFEAWKVTYQEGGKNARDNPPAVASGPNMKFNPDGSPNPNYRPPAKPKPGQNGRTPAQQRLRENAANSAIKSTFINPTTGQIRPSLKIDTKDNTWIVRQINSALSQNGISPTSPNGIRIRKSWLTRLGIKSGARGNPAYP